jgi:uncharacterized caspase-like protein
MGKNDWAVVVGIQSYFDSGALGALAGPENDATEFFEWVTSSTGGAVPKDQAILILSSTYKPPFTSAAAAMPTKKALKLAFDHLKKIAEENDSKKLGLSVGDRLYVFMAGHGFAPDIEDELTALLTAEASVTKRRLNHVIGSYMADWFWRAAYFKQVLLFMDCCRSVLPCTQPYKPYKDRRGRDYDKVRRFYAYGARVTQESREWTPEGRKCHGVFTMTLLNGLRGAAYDTRDPKNITAESLRDYLYTDFKNFMVPADRTRSNVRDIPEVDYEQRPNSNFVIAPSPPKTLVERVIGARAQKFPVRIVASGSSIGKKVEIQNWTLKPVFQVTLQQTNDLQLQRGIFLITGPDIEVEFEVTGKTEVVNVAA